MPAAQFRRLPRVCPSCGEVFEPRRVNGTWTKTCSAECRNAEQARRMREGQAARAAAARRRLPTVTVACHACGAPYDVPPYLVSRARACSRECARVLRQRANANRSGSANPNWRGGSRAGVRNRAGESRWYDVAHGHCAVCGGEGGQRGITLHHVVYRQHVAKEGGDIWDPRNAMPLCDSDHLSHHRRGRIIAVDLLPDTALVFAAELFGGPRAVDYFRRYYAGDDRRLNELERKYPLRITTPGAACTRSNTT